uniref:F-box protein At5g03100-like n=1 Tax=Tanacetum cinerariifolium TaxID=118510 RepID=A0A699HLL1_TANCI|nr:F-box protein At5g03100-like [Tanacetum cinerariifolium]
MWLCKFVLHDVSSLVKAKLDYYKQGGYYETLDEEEVEEEMLKGFILSLRHVKERMIGKLCLQVLSRLEAKGLVFPSGMKLPDADHLVDPVWEELVIVVLIVNLNFGLKYIKSEVASEHDRIQGRTSASDEQESTAKGGASGSSVREQGNVPLQCPKLTDTNYTTWNMMEKILKAYELWKVIDETDGKKETSGKQETAIDEKAENTAKGMIFQTLKMKESEN